MALPASAQIQQAWVARYNNGIPSGTNQAVKMALDTAGNIYVTGFSQNASGNLGYITTKYAPNGNQLWAARYDSTSYPSATPAAMVLDGSNDVIVTGSALTIKYDPNGNELWNAPYAGTALAVDSNANVYVAGFSTNFGTVKLNPAGGKVWLTTYTDVSTTISQSVLVDSTNNVYVSGLDSYEWESESESDPNYGYYAVALTTIKYGSNGSPIWKTSRDVTYMGSDSLQVEGGALDSSDNLYLVSNWNWPAGYVTFKYASNGTLQWIGYPPGGPENMAYALALRACFKNEEFI